MLYEDDVVDAVSRHLQAHGWNILTVAHAHQHGDDIVARREAVTLRVEAKGAGSSKAASKRFGQSFTRNQVGSHVSVAVYRALTWVSGRPTDRPALAFPDNADHRRQIVAVSNALHALGIGVFWVQEDGDVQLDAPWVL